ncbi:MAG: hypothetical protein AAF430_00510 [Myxococcota bacterium]
MRVWLSWFSVLLWLGANAVSPAGAVIIDSGDGSGNTTAPSPDPGWAHLGIGLGNGLTIVYLGDGAVLTANHVGPQSVLLGGVTYASVPGSDVRISNGDGSFADLLLFEIFPRPSLPSLTIASATPSMGTAIIAGGRGRNRGPATSWNPPGPGGSIDGYLWDPGNTLRWGTNHVEVFPAERVLGTESIGSTFDEFAANSPHECQAATGDSGGAAFVDNGGNWELAGLLFAIAEFENQPADTSLYGQLTYFADLAFYKAEIENLVMMPEPRGALGWGGLGVCALAALRRRRARA